MLICSGCSKPHRRRGQRYCLRCHREYQSTYRRKARRRTISGVNGLLAETRSRVRVISISDGGHLKTRRMPAG